MIHITLITISTTALAINIIMQSSMLVQAIITAQSANNWNHPEIKATNCSYGLCEAVEDYPDQLVIALLEENDELKSFFVPKIPDIDERFNNEFRNLCEVKRSVIRPKSGTTVFGETRLIANTDQYQQSVVTEVCREHALCHLREYWPYGFESKCVPKMVEVSLAVLNENKEKLVVEKFSHPSGCYCAYKSQ